MEEKNIYMCLGSDHIYKRNRNVMSAKNLFLNLDHMLKNRKSLSEAQKIDNNVVIMGFLKYQSCLSLVEESSHKGKKKSSQIRYYPMVVHSFPSLILNIPN